MLFVFWNMNIHRSMLSICEDWFADQIGFRCCLEIVEVGIAKLAQREFTNLSLQNQKILTTDSWTEHGKLMSLTCKSVPMWMMIYVDIFQLTRFQQRKINYYSV